MKKYLDSVKDEFKYRFFSYLLMAVAAGSIFPFYSGGNFSFLGIFLSVFLYVFSILLFNAYVSHKDKKIPFGKSLSMTYLEYVKHEIIHNYPRFLIVPVVAALALYFFSTVSCWIIFSYSAILLIGAPFLSAYTKKMSRKF